MMRETDAAPMTVSRLNQYVNELLRDDALLRSLRLRGQISGLIRHRSGHWYFDLKDEMSTISCVMFASSAAKVLFQPRNGDQVVLHGSVSLYTQAGKYQFYADRMQPEGTGTLWQRYEQLRAMLSKEGLFREERKRSLPWRPSRIAVVTSESGAVLHDICRVCRNRDPGIPLVLVPVPVQGEAAAPQIAEGLRTAASLPDVDLIIVGRGGGSMEDLWCFNDEAVVRAIAASPVPVISAVGHETDYTLADFAADRRASTPSNAAEIAVPDRKELILDMEEMRLHLDRAADFFVEALDAAIMKERHRLLTVSPEQRLQEMSFRLRTDRRKLDGLADTLVQEIRPRLAMAAYRLDAALDQTLHRAEECAARSKSRLEGLNPLRVLDRGYAMVTSGGRVVTSAKEAPVHMCLTFRDGSLTVRREEE